MSEMRDWRKAIDELFEGQDSVWNRKYPDTAEGAKAFLDDISTWDASNATATPDPQVDGVWLVTGLVERSRTKRGLGGSPAITGRAIVYLAGYKDPFGRIRTENDFESEEVSDKVSNPLEEANVLAGASVATESDLAVQELPDGWYRVSVDATGGPLISLIRTLAYQSPTHARTKSGSKLPQYHVFKANGVLIKAANRDVLDDKIERALKKHNAYVKSETRHKEKAPQRKIAAAKYSAEQAKKRKAEQETKYGKGTASRVTYRQEGGDDGYQYVVRVDGSPKWNGLTRSQAEYYANLERDAIAKKEGLGQYAKPTFYPAVSEAIVEVPAGLRGEDPGNAARLTRADAERFINELDPMDTPDTEVVDPESGEVLDWPDRKTRQAQDDAEQEASYVEEPQEPEDLTPTFYPPRNQDQVWDLMHQLRDSDFYDSKWESVANLVDNPEEMANLDYDVNFDMPIMISRKDGQPLTDKDMANIKLVVKVSKYASPMNNIGMLFAGKGPDGTYIEFTPMFM